MFGDNGTPDQSTVGHRPSTGSRGNMFRSREHTIADDLNENLTAPRRTNQSYDYLAHLTSDGVEKTPKNRKAGLYHEAPESTRRKSFDYVHADQNRNTQPKPQVSDFHTDSNDDDDDALDGEEDWVCELLRNQIKTLDQAMDLAVASEDKPKWKLANAGPIGLLGFGITTVLLNLHNTGHYPLMTVVPASGICFGGIAQFAAGLLEFTRGNTFGYVAFCSYSAFWTSLVCIWLLPGVAPTTGYMVGVYMLVWTIYSFMMMICTLRLNVTIFLLFLSLVILFLLLAIGNMTGSVDTIKAAGYEGVVCGSIALYLAFAEILNEVWDRTLLPIGPMSEVIGWFSKKEEDKASEDGDAEAISGKSPKTE